MPTGACSGSGLFPPPDILRIFCIYRQYGKGAGFLPVPGPDSGGPGIITCVGASQIISNVPAALLLSGFSGDYSALIVGTNLGGLGTLIASMASLISYKHIARMYPMEKGRYLGWFTAVNLLFLAVLLVLSLWVIPF